MEKQDLYNIQDGDLGSEVANGLKQNFENIVDELNVKQASGEYATKAELKNKVSGSGVSAVSVVSVLPDPQEEGVLYIVTGEEG